MDTFVAPMGKVTDVDEWTVRRSFNLMSLTLAAPGEGDPP